jgi:hypothetical protein
MKNIILVFILCTTASANAGMYKCISNSKTSYQSSPCPKEEDENEFSLKFDLSKEQIQQAIDKKAAELEADNEQKRLDKMAYDKERLIQAEEDKAREAVLQTEAMRERNDIELYKLDEAARQTDAIREQNDIERYKRNNAVHIKYEVETLKQYGSERLTPNSNHKYVEKKKNDKTQPIGTRSGSIGMVITK